MSQPNIPHARVAYQALWADQLLKPAAKKCIGNTKFDFVLGRTICYWRKLEKESGKNYFARDSKGATRCGDEETENIIALSDFGGKEAGAAPADFGFRPGSNLGGPLVLYGTQYPGGKAFNPAAFTLPPTGQLGDFGRNVLRSFGAQADVAFQRQFRLTEKMALRFRGEFFNLFNHRNFGPPNNNLTDALFGQSTQTLASSLGSGGANEGFNPSIKSADDVRSSWHSNFNSEHQTAGPSSVVIESV